MLPRVELEDARSPAETAGDLDATMTVYAVRLRRSCGAVAVHHRCHRRQVGRASGRDVKDGPDLTEVPGAEDAGGDDREGLRVHAVGVVEAVDGPAGNDERFAGADAWAQQLGPRRFGQLRGVLLEVNQLT
jgi:hypothetical protein